MSITGDKDLEDEIQDDDEMRQPVSSVDQQEQQQQQPLVPILRHLGAGVCVCVCVCVCVPKIKMGPGQCERNWFEVCP